MILCFSVVVRAMTVARVSSNQTGGVTVPASATIVEILNLDLVDASAPMTCNIVINRVSRVIRVHVRWYHQTLIVIDARIVSKAYNEFGKTAYAAVSQSKAEEVCHLYALLAGEDHTAMYLTVVRGPVSNMHVTCLYHLLNQMLSLNCLPSSIVY